jgi:hypothetical protein
MTAIESTQRSEEVTVRPYDEICRDAHARFAAKMWPSKRRRREESYIRWKFRGPRAGPVNGLLVALVNGDVVGQLGLIPATVSVGGQRMMCQWACDLMVDSSLRRRGIASCLFDVALARGIVTLGSNPSSAADVTMQRIGFGSLEGPAMGVLPLDPAHILSWKIPSGLKMAIPAVSAAARPVFWWRGRRLGRDARGAWKKVERGSWRMVARLVAEQQACQADPFIVHDEEFLAWRCEGLAGYVEPLGVLRTEDGSYAIVGAGKPYFYVFDWWSASWESFCALFWLVRMLAREARGKTLEAYAQTGEEEEWLRRAGFLFFRRRCKILCNPQSVFIPQTSRMRYSIFDSDGNL